MAPRLLRVLAPLLDLEQLVQKGRRDRAFDRMIVAEARKAVGDDVELMVENRHSDGTSLEMPVSLRRENGEWKVVPTQVQITFQNEAGGPVSTPQAQP